MRVETAHVNGALQKETLVDDVTFLSGVVFTR